MLLRLAAIRRRTALLAARQLGMPDDAIYRSLQIRGFLPCCSSKAAPDMLLDGAHNSAAVDALLGVLSEIASEA